MTALTDRRPAVDGSIELFAGITLMLIGWSWLLDLPVLGAILPALLVPVWSSVRRKHLQPSSGDPLEDALAQKRRRVGLMALAAIGSFTLFMGVVIFLVFERWGHEIHGLHFVWAGLPAATVGFAGILSAFALEYPRAALHGGAFLLAGVGVVLLRANPGWGLVAGGLVTTLGGLSALRGSRSERPGHPTRIHE